MVQGFLPVPPLRLLTVLLGALLLAGLAARGGESAAKAPDPAAKKAPSPTEAATARRPAPGTETPAGPKAAAKSPAPAEEGGTIRGKNLWETFSRGGPLMYPILVCSFIAVAFAIERFVSLRQGVVAPKALGGKVLAAVREEGTAEGIRLCEERPSALGRVLAAGLGTVPAPREEIVAAMQEAGERELWHLERFAKPLSVIAGVAPLLGLLGTVWGMIMAFDVVAAKGALGDPRELAEGIATALLTTFAGLSVAIPSFVLYHYFRSKSDRMILEIEETGSHLLAQLHGASDDAHPAPQGGGRGPAPHAPH